MAEWTEESRCFGLANFGRVEVDLEEAADPIPADDGSAAARGAPAKARAPGLEKQWLAKRRAEEGK